MSGVGQALMADVFTYSACLFGERFLCIETTAILDIGHIISIDRVKKALGIINY